jgi:hypothetical protein
LDSVRYGILTSWVIILLVLQGCGDRPPTPSPVAPTSSPTLSADEVTDAIRFRTSVGLRSDEPWILIVAADPASRAGAAAYGTPLTPAEKAELDARSRSAEALSGVVELYGSEHRDEWAGAFLDHTTGSFVTRFTGSLDEHEAALRRLIHPDARLEVRPAAWSLAELERRRHAVDRDAEQWLRTIRAWPAGSGVDVVANRVQLDISSRNPDAPALAIARFDGDGWLLVRSDGIGRWEGLLGTAIIYAVTRSGQPARWLDCVLTPDDPAAWLGGVAYGTGDRGSCPIEGIAATGYLVELKIRRGDTEDWVVIGHGRVVVPPNGTGVATIEVDIP